MIPFCSSCGNTTHANLLRAAVPGIANILMALTDQEQAVIDKANRC